MEQNPIPAPTAAAREVVLVCGMHRSGTSAVTRVCNLVGGALPQPLVEAAVGNEFGLWEPAEVVAMNDRALLAAGGDVNDAAPISPSWLRSAAAHRFEQEVEAYIGALGEAPGAWFIKDPRISVLAGLWRKGVARAGAEPRMIIAFRNPWEVAASLCARQLHHFPDEVWPLERGLAIWLNYVLSVERKSRGMPRSFVDYERFLSDWPEQTSRIYRQIGLPPPSLDPDVRSAVGAFLRPEERHARYDPAHAQTSLVMRVYELLLARLDDPDGGKAEFDRAFKAYTASFDILGGYMGALEARAREIGPLKAGEARAEEEVERLKQNAEQAERRLAHLVRVKRSAPVEGGDRPAEAPDKTEPADDRLPANRHEALKTAHRENVSAFKAARAAWRHDREKLVEDQAAGIADAIAAERKDWRDERDAVFLSQTTALKGQIATLEQTLRLHADAVAAEREEWRREHDAVVLSQTIALKAQIATLENELRLQANEMTDGREAYEALRLEAADVRAPLARAVEEITRLVRENDHHTAALAGVQAELEAVRRSRSWKITAPIRIVTTRLLGRRGA